MHCDARSLVLLVLFLRPPALMVMLASAAWMRRDPSWTLPPRQGRNTAASGLRTGRAARHDEPADRVAAQRRLGLLAGGDPRRAQRACAIRVRATILSSAARAYSRMAPGETGSDRPEFAENLCKAAAK